MMFEQILSWLITFAVETINFFGYFGIIVLMALESTLFPIPSELVMPFAGYLAYEGKMNFYIAVLAGGIGSVLGSLASYYIGMFGGNAFISKFGKYFLIHEDDMNWTISFFKKHGEKAIFISRFLPVVRHLVSFPAGVAKMDLKKFIIYTFIGATLWSLILVYLGYFLGSKWEEIHHITKNFSYLMVLVLFAIGVWYIWRHFNRKKKK